MDIIFRDLVFKPEIFCILHKGELHKRVFKMLFNVVCKLFAERCNSGTIGKICDKERIYFAIYLNKFGFDMYLCTV
jgi:hypothetical protein